jgi:hypothetical protein
MSYRSPHIILIYKGQKIMTRPGWYPRALAERAAWHSNFAKQAGEQGAAVGLNVEDIADIELDSSVVQYLNTTNEYLEAEMKSWRDARDAFFEQETVAPAPAIPAFNITVPPVGAIAAIIVRTVKFADKIELSDNYSEAVGKAFGIVATKPEPPPIDNVKPTLKAAAKGDWKVALRVSLKGFDGVKLEMRRDGDTAWTSLGMYPSGEIIDDTATFAPDKPETRSYRAVFVKKNTPVGEYSDTVEVTVHA